MLKRILLTTDAVGGVWNYSVELARGLSARDVEVVLAVMGPPPDTAQRREAALLAGVRLVVTGLPLDWLADTPDQAEFSAQVLAAMAREVDADTVQLHAPALIGHLVWPVPVVAVVHSCVGTWWRAVRGGPLPPDLAWRAEATRVGITRADAVVAPSASFAEALRNGYGILRPITVVFNAKTIRIAGEKRMAHALTAGRFWDEGKNVTTLDAAAAYLSWPVMAAGSESGPNGAQTHCRHLRMLGALDASALATEYSRASIFVSVARYEPFGLAVLEAAQAGCALVLSDIPTFRELWDGAAVFVPSDEPNEIAAAMDSLFRHRDVLFNLAARAAQRAVLFSVPRMIDATWRIHRQLAVAKRAAA